MQAVAVAPRGIQRLFGAVAIAAALLAGGVTLAAGWPASSGQPLTKAFALDGLPEGVTEVRVHGRPVFLHRTGSTFVAISPVTQGGDPVVWCAEDSLFVSHLHRSTFTPSGERVSGPSTSDLPTYAVRTQWNEVIVDVTRAHGGGRGRHGTASWSAAERNHACSWV